MSNITHESHKSHKSHKPHKSHKSHKPELIKTFNNIFLTKETSNVDGGAQDYYFDVDKTSYNPKTLLEDSMQSYCMCCCNGWHDSRFPGHSHALVNGIYPSKSVYSYHPSVEKHGYFNKNVYGIGQIELVKGKGLFKLLPDEIVELIESFMIDHYCLACVRDEECNQRTCQKYSCFKEKYCYCTLQTLIETGKKHKP